VLSGRGSARIPQSNKKHNFEPKLKKIATPRDRDSNEKQAVNQDISNPLGETVVDMRFLMRMKKLEQY